MTQNPYKLVICVDHFTYKDQNGCLGEFGFGNTITNNILPYCITNCLTIFTIFKFKGDISSPCLQDVK